MPPSYIRVRAAVWAYGRGQTDSQTHRQTDTQTRVTTIHFASSTTHAKCNKEKLECGSMPNVMADLPNIHVGGALCSTVQHRKVWLTPTAGVPCSNAAKTRKPLKLAEVPQTTVPVSAASGPKFTILWAHLHEILVLNKFFFRLSIRALVAKTQPDKVVRWCPDGQFLAFFVSCISASRVQHISDLHSKFALRPHHVCKYGRHPICDR